MFVDVVADLGTILQNNVWVKYISNSNTKFSED